MTAELTGAGNGVRDAPPECKRERRLPGIWRRVR